MSGEIPEIIDHSRVDAYAATRRRAMLLHSVWRPMLAGAAGAALVVAAVWVATPKFLVREVIVDHVVSRDLPINNLVPRDITIDIPHFVQHDVNPPIAANPPARRSPPSDAPKTPGEKKFADTYKGAVYFGRIVTSIDGRAISFADGKSLWPARWTGSDWSSDIDDSKAYITDLYIGDLAACAPVSGHADLMSCHALHHGREADIRAKDIEDAPPRRAGARPQRSEFAALLVSPDAQP